MALEYEYLLYCFTSSRSFAAILAILKIFDRLFADFEFNYVQCMVHVKSVREYELHQAYITIYNVHADRGG